MLQDVGVTPHLHKVRLKPGKPLFFGTREQDRRKRLVFGLPGNPVSSLVCFELFLRPALLGLAGQEDLQEIVEAELAEDFPYRTDRPTYHPAWLEWEEAPRVWPVPWFGSADLRAFLKANALLVLPEGDHRHRAGQTLDVLRLDG